MLDLGQWWYEQTGLPLPLGGNVVRQDLGDEMVLKIAIALEAEHPVRPGPSPGGARLRPAYARDLDPALADRFVGMYVNDWTVDYGPEGREAVRLFLERGAKLGLVPGPLDIQFVG